MTDTSPYPDRIGIKCPHCGKGLIVPLYATHNADAYGKPVTVASLCCGKAIMIKPIRSLRFTKDESDKENDDWGVKIKK